MSHDTNDKEDSDVVEESSNMVRHNWEEPFNPSVTIIEAVAAATGRSTKDLPPLHEHIDPEALDTLITRGRSASVTISFTYAGTVIVVDGDGNIEIQVDG